jgi:hypothetical protein
MKFKILQLKELLGQLAVLNNERNQGHFREEEISVKISEIKEIVGELK